ncbi:hypothetical protein D9758_010202 [Tetrapyrgos nigripes]|uniref:Uncharacterized protein n=1 Tax=Tetrapyrgos nigripes TaxID=182062 RepID=A0A8H5FUP4_9AGAR|nr:hypothetical protein D9758_010202 [Tetrapyrgos nigripes]
MIDKSMSSPTDPNQKRDSLAPPPKYEERPSQEVVTMPQPVVEQPKQTPIPRSPSGDYPPQVPSPSVMLSPQTQQPKTPAQIGEEYRAACTCILSAAEDENCY